MKKDNEIITILGTGLSLGVVTVVAAGGEGFVPMMLIGFFVGLIIVIIAEW